jgi:hypothetical protein
MRCKKHIAHTAKKTKARVFGRLATNTLKRNTTLKGRRRLNVNQISSSRNNHSPKVRKNRGGNHKSTSGLKKMAMLMFSNPILSMSTWRRVSERYSPVESA